MDSAEKDGTDGIDWTGKAFDKVYPVEKGKVGVLWCGVRIPIDLPPGEYSGYVTIMPRGQESSRIMILLNVAEEILGDAGDSDPWRHSRLRWLDWDVVFNGSLNHSQKPFLSREKEVYRII